MIVYIASNITSRLAEYKERFICVQKMLESKGYIVINPAMLPTGLNAKSYLPICFAMIDAADAIYLFDDWEKSKGALLEKAYAEYQGKEVLLNV